MKIYGKNELEQGTKEWLDLRKLKFTASSANTVIAKGKGLDTLICEMVTDYYSSGEYPEYSKKFKSEDMQRGNDFESMARMIYEFEKDVTVIEVGFVENNEHCGCSPDGLVGEDGLVEFKNHSDKVFRELMTTKKVDKKYLDQMQWQMWSTGRKWCDYVGFNPNFTPNVYIERVYADQDVFDKIEEGLEIGIGRLKYELKITGECFCVPTVETEASEKVVENVEEIKEKVSTPFD